MGTAATRNVKANNFLKIEGLFINGNFMNLSMNQQKSGFYPTLWHDITADLLD